MQSTSLITIETVSKIQQNLDAYDRRSLVFLLYNNPVIALQKIVENDNALKEWVIESSQDHNWPEKFIESLAICKLFGIIKKLGFDLTKVRARYSPQIIDTSVYVDPVKKLFYLMSEQITNKDFNIIKSDLRFDIDTEAEDTKDLEIIVLKVMCAGKNMENLLTAIAKIPLLTTFVLQIRERHLGELLVNADASPCNVEIHSSNKYYECTESDKLNDLDELDYYPIKNLQTVGLAYIINQKDFTKNVTNHQLTNRDGSDVDQLYLQYTLKKIKFEVFVSKNLTSKEIMQQIANIVCNNFKTTHSIFLLCILSHGIKGQIFGTDCIPVKVKNIQKLIDTMGKEKLRNIPKVIFLQACQVNENLVADAPLALDYLIHWATSEDYEAFRGTNGSIFIRVLCDMLLKHGHKEHLADICTKVNNYVNKICEREKVVQLPNYQITLRKKLYLSPPL